MNGQDITTGLYDEAGDFELCGPAPECPPEKEETLGRLTKDFTDAGGVVSPSVANALRALAGLESARARGAVRTVLVPGQLRSIQPVPRRRRRRG